MIRSISRLDFLKRMGLLSSACTLGGCRLFAGRERKFAVNASTIRGYGLSLKDQVKAAVEAGCRGYEPWLKDVHAARASGDFADVVRMARDGGLQFVNGIAFGQWASDDARLRSAGMEEMARDMEALSALGCPRIAACMYGMQKPGTRKLSAAEIAERYLPVLDLGCQMGVQPLLEYWGHSANMNRLEDAVSVLDVIGERGTAVLADVYHTYRGGGEFGTFMKLEPDQLPVLHVNDFPANKDRLLLVDADRVWPGDGAAPWQTISEAIDGRGLDPWLSVELFNPAYWRSTPVQTMRTAQTKARLALG